ncbi:MAG: hypothetical protein MJ237_06415 [bacterium]|nr:hypothetical protein [bacterium]
MINNITGVDARFQMGVAKTAQSHYSTPIPPILGFKTPKLGLKATLRVNKFKRRDGIVIVGDIDDDYVEVVEEEIDDGNSLDDNVNFFQAMGKRKRKLKYLKECYVIDYIQAPQVRCGLGTQAIKGLAEKAMFDDKIQGRIVTFSAPLCNESSPAQFFYKLGFRFVEQSANEHIKDCLIKNIPDLPAQTGMMYLPKENLQKLLRYGDLF